MSITNRSWVYTSGSRTGLNALDTLIRREAIAVYDKMKLFGKPEMCNYQMLPAWNTFYQFSITDEPTLTTSNSALVEGQTPTSDAQSYQSVVVEANQYGQVKTLTDRTLRQSPINIYWDTARTIWEGLARVRDFSIQEAINDWDNVLYGWTATSRATVAAADVLTSTNIANVAARLSSNWAEKITIDGNTAYCAIIHPNVAFDLKTATTVTSPSWAWLSVSWDSKAAEDLRMWYIWYLFGVHVFESNNLQFFAWAWAAWVDVYPCYFFGKDAYWVVEEETLDIMTTWIWTPSDSDPLAQRVHISWRFSLWTDILKQDSMIRYEVATWV